MARKYLVTGGAGFIGSNFIRYLFEHEPDAQVTNLDALTYAGVPATVDELDADPRHDFVKGDIRDVDLIADVVPGHDVIVHFAAESHVDRSILGPGPFLSTNVVGTGVLLEAGLKHDVSRFIHISTDEVYGSVAEGFASEEARLDPSSPYSSSKASADLLARSYHITHGYDVVITRCTNNYGPYQFPEKIVPLFVTNLLEGRRIPLYGDGLNERDWLYVEDHCSAVHLLVDKGAPGDVYNIGAGAQLPNIELTGLILELLGKDDTWIKWVPDRLGHDFRYAVDTTKLGALGWSPHHDVSERLEDTIAWYQQRRDWWGPLKDPGR